MQNRNSSATTKVNEASTHQLTSCIRLSPYKKWSPSKDNNGRYMVPKFPNYCSVCNTDTIQKTVNSVRNIGTISSSTKESIHFEPYTIQRNSKSPPLLCTNHQTKEELMANSYKKTESPSKDSFYTSSPQRHQFGSNSSDSPVKTGYINNCNMGSPLQRNGFLRGGSTSPEPNYLQPMMNGVTKSPKTKHLEDPIVDTLTHSTFRKMMDSTTTRDLKSPIKMAYHRNNTQIESPIKKCGNSSCNGIEPLKETHITTINGSSNTCDMENRYREEVALLRGKLREFSKKNNNPNENTPAPVEKKFKEYHSPESPKLLRKSPLGNCKRPEILIEIDSTDNVQSPVYVMNGGGMRDRSNGVKKLFCENNGEDDKVVKKVQRKKQRRKISTTTTTTCGESSGSESEISDSECSEPEDVDAEEKQINYETVLNELASIKNDLYLAYNTPHPESGDTSNNLKHTSILRPSLFPHVPPYLRFFPHDQCGPKMPSSIQKQLKWRLSNITPVIVRKTLINSGFRLLRTETINDPDDLFEADWIGTWGKHIKSPMFKQLKEHQKMNHFPGTFQLGRKDRLWRNTQKLQLKYGLREFNYVPKTYILPQDLKQLRHVWEKGESTTKWILKPPASARGTGIRVVNKWNQIPKKKPLVVQKYIENPYLINGSKFDLRLYVLMTSFDPLRIYLYPDGLARFASVKYSADCSTLDNRYMHLTNYSINKLSRDYTANEDAGACQGHKWTIQALWEYLGKRGVNTEKLWESLQDLVIKTIISGESGITQLLRGNVGSRYNCYELFGVDVLLDENLKPWLLEVNISPSLHSTSPLDLFVKGPMVQTLLNMAQYHIPNDTIKTHQRENILKNLGLSPPSADKHKTDTEEPSEEHHNGAGDDESSDIQLNFDPRIYSVQLTMRERSKHKYVTTRQHRDEYLDDILSSLTPDDVRHLIIAEDELQAAGKFQKIFPTTNSHHYLSLMEIRYYDRLFDAWESKYGSNRKLGIGILQAYCAKKYHLITPPPAKMHKENVTPETKQEVLENSPKVVSPVNNVTTSPPIAVNPSTQGTTEGPSPSRKPRYDSDTIIIDHDCCSF